METKKHRESNWKEIMDQVVQEVPAQLKPRFQYAYDETFRYAREVAWDTRGLIACEHPLVGFVRFVTQMIPKPPTEDWHFRVLATIVNISPEEARRRFTK